MESLLKWEQNKRTVYFFRKDRTLYRPELICADNHQNADVFKTIEARRMKLSAFIGIWNRNNMQQFSVSTNQHMIIYRSELKLVFCLSD